MVRDACPPLMHPTTAPHLRGMLLAQHAQHLLVLPPCLAQLRSLRRTLLLQRRQLCGVAGMVGTFSSRFINALVATPSPCPPTRTSPPPGGLGWPNVPKAWHSCCAVTPPSPGGRLFERYLQQQQPTWSAPSSFSWRRSAATSCSWCSRCAMSLALHASLSACAGGSQGGGLNETCRDPGRPRL